jgi:hypothetical protein
VKSIYLAIEGDVAALFGKGSCPPGPWSLHWAGGAIAKAVVSLEDEESDDGLSGASSMKGRHLELVVTMPLPPSG